MTAARLLLIGLGLALVLFAVRALRRAVSALEVAERLLRRASEWLVVAIEQERAERRDRS